MLSRLYGVKLDWGSATRPHLGCETEGRESEELRTDSEIVI